MPSPYLEWRAAHGYKRKYGTRWQAWLVVLRIWLRERRPDSLHPYLCTWAVHPHLGQAAEPHWHIGHARYSRRTRNWRNRLVVWPYYRARRAVRTRWRAYKSHEP